MVGARVLAAVRCLSTAAGPVEAVSDQAVAPQAGVRLESARRCCEEGEGEGV